MAFVFSKRMEEFLSKGDAFVLSILEAQAGKGYAANDRTLRAALEYIQFFADREIMLYMMEQQALGESQKKDFIDLIIDHDGLPPNETMKAMISGNIANEV